MAKSLYRRIQIFFRSLFQRNAQQSDLDEEIELHIEELTEEYMEEGLSRKVARKKALKRFGSVEWIKDDTRDSWGTQRLVDSLRDFKFGLRLTFKHLSSSILAVIVLALGIGISTIMFTAASKLRNTSGGVDLQDNQLYIDWEVGQKQGEPVLAPDFKHLQQEVDSLENLIGFGYRGYFLHLPTEKTEGKQYNGIETTPNFFSITNTSPVAGRLFSAQDGQTSDAGTVIISHSVSSDFFDNPKDAVGAEVYLNGERCMVVGVMPKGFAFPGNRFIWKATDWSNYNTVTRARSPRMRITGTMKEGLLIPQVRAELDTIAENLASEFPGTNEDYSRFKIILFKDRFIDDDSVIFLGLALLGSFLVLSVACANVFQIVIARTAIRSHELAIRCSLGAKRSHVIWQVMVDGLTLSTIGAFLGLGLASMGLRFISAQLTLFNMPGLHTFQLTSGAIVFVLIAATLSGVISSLIPAWRASKINANEILKDDNKSSGNIYIGWLSKTLVISQVTFSSILLFLSMFLLFPSFFIGSVKMPYEQDNLLTARVTLSRQAFESSPDALPKFYQNLKPKLMAIPGVEATGLTSAHWGIMGEKKPRSLEIEGRSQGDERHTVQKIVVSPDFLEAYAMQATSGRTFNAFDTKDSLRVCIVNQNFAKTHYPDSDPIGKRIRMKFVNKPNEWMTIVGVVPVTIPDIPTSSKAEAEMMEQAFCEVILPFTQHPEWSPTILLRAPKASSSHYRAALREAIRETDSSVDISGSILTTQERLDIIGEFIRAIFNGGQLFGGAILIMSITGLYTIISFTTAQRRKELGIRMAVGSSAWGIAKSVIKPWSIAILVGLSLAGITCLIMWSFYSSLAPNDISAKDNLLSILTMFGPVVVLVGIGSLISMALPAWRAIKIAPMEVIRVE